MSTLWSRIASRTPLGWLREVDALCVQRIAVPVLSMNEPFDDLTERHVVELLEDEGVEQFEKAWPQLYTSDRRAITYQIAAAQKVSTEAPRLHREV